MSWLMKVCILKDFRSGMEIALYKINIKTLKFCRKYQNKKGCVQWIIMVFYP